MKFNKALLEYYGVDPARVPDFEEFWALYATSFYERLFKRMDDPGRMQQIYMKYLHNPKLDKRDKAALTFFYNIRRDELDDPNYWDKVGRGSFEEINKNESKTPMKAKLVKESLNESMDVNFVEWFHDFRRKYPMIDTSELIDIMVNFQDNPDLQYENSQELIDVLVNSLGYPEEAAEELLSRLSTYNEFDNHENILALIRYAGPERDNEAKKRYKGRLYNESLKENLNESVSRYCGIWKANNGKWYLDLANNEYGEYEDCTTYGPFSSESGAEKHLKNFSNPGGSWTDDEGDREPPTESPNGRPVQRPSGGGMTTGNYPGRRW